MRHTMIIGTCLVLSACSATQDYSPTLLLQPKNAAKYDADRKHCIAESNAKYAKAEDEERSSGRFLLGAFGAIGGALQGGMRDKDNALNKTPTMHVDDCLAQKGYKIAR